MYVSSWLFSLVCVFVEIRDRHWTGAQRTQKATQGLQRKNPSRIGAIFRKKTTKKPKPTEKELRRDVSVCVCVVCICVHANKKGLENKQQHKHKRRQKPAQREREREREFPKRARDGDNSRWRQSHRINKQTKQAQQLLANKQTHTNRSNKKYSFFTW